MALKLIWLSDLHLSATDDPEGTASKARLMACLDDAWRHYPDADLCVVSGDIGNRGSAAEYDAFAAMGCDRWKVLKVLPGNHDDPDSLARAMGMPGRYWPECVSIGGSRLVFLDTSLKDEDGGRIGTESLAWLEKTGTVLIFVLRRGNCSLRRPTYEHRQRPFGSPDARAFAR